MDLRPAVFAGTWYPKRAAACESEIKEFLASATPRPQSPSSWLGGVVPHAGWYYSGQIACNVIHWLKEAAPADVVVIFGMHLSARSANHMMPSGAWETPFGPLPVAEDLAEHLMGQFEFNQETTNRFVQDNTIELQLPFVKYLLNPERILGIGTAPNPRALDIARAVVDWAGQNGRKLKIIGSTDLTHYGSNYGFSPHGSGAKALDWVRHENDRGVIEAMLAMNPAQVMVEGTENQNACCSGAAAAAVAAVQKMGATVAREVCYATSHDKSPGDSFVGYVGVAFA